MNFYYWLGYHLSRLLAKLFFGFRILHRERMIQTGPVILASNHQSYFDPPLAGNACDRPIYFLARRNLMNVPVLGWLLPKLNVIPVNQEGIDRSALKALIQVIKAGNGALVFPEGSRTMDGSLQPGLPGIGLVIAKTLAPGRADANLRRARSASARPKKNAVPSHHRRGRRTDSFHHRRSRIRPKRPLRAPKPARHGRHRRDPPGITVAAAVPGGILHSKLDVGG